MRIAMESSTSATQEMALLLRAFVAQHRAMHGGQAPAAISVSPDIFPLLEREKEPSLALKRTASGYTFEGIAIEPRVGQTLPFMLRRDLRDAL